MVSALAWTTKRALLGALAALLLTASVGSLYGQDAPPREQRGAPAADSSTDAPPAESVDEPAGAGAPLPRGKKLILTDGEFHIVREYERQGDRVRFYSVERSSWEEIPADLVDWAATEKAGAELEAQQNEVVERLQAERAEAIAASIDSDRSLEVRPGVILPDPPGFYALDGQTVLTMEQQLAVARLDKGRAAIRIITGLPMISSKHQIEMAGKRSKIRVRSPEPEFFFRTDDGRNPTMTLVRAEIDGDKRRVTTAVTDLTGTTKYEHREVPTMTSEAASRVQRLTMGQKLAPGEYALIETTAEGISMYVWDFGVDAAPAQGNTRARPAARPNSR
jgi:hypothetical protein